MSKSVAKASGEEQGAPESASVYDFLYHDSRRIGSFLAQFDENGLLTGLKRGESVTKGASRGFRLGVGASSPMFGGGNIDIERGPGEAGEENLERAYDPHWANAREFLDALTERHMIQRNITEARIGQFVLVSGSLIIADLKMLKSFWPLPMVQKAMSTAAVANSTPEPTGNRQQRLSQQSQQRRQPKGPSDEIKIVMEVLPHLPHSGQMHIVNEDFAVWGSAAEGAMISDMSDLVLMHGAKVAGTWNMLGILDALPYEPNQALTPVEMVRSGMTSDSIAKAALSLGPYIRTAMGRPLLSYGMTPLLVFRTVA